MAALQTLKPSPINALIPTHSTVQLLSIAAQSCTDCERYCNATQAVFSEGSPQAEVMLIGESPGDEEDRTGRPFVGPAGRLLRQVLDEVGFKAADLYFTNAVKHFKWEARGKRRIHVKPDYREVVACRPWLQAEIDLVRPQIVVCLGSTAAQSFMGREFRVTRHLGRIIPPSNDFSGSWQPREPFYFVATLHPAAILRMPTHEARFQARAEFTAHLASARELFLRTRVKSANDIGAS